MYTRAHIYTTYNTDIYVYTHTLSSDRDGQSLFSESTVQGGNTCLDTTTCYDHGRKLTRWGLRLRAAGRNRVKG